MRPPPDDARPLPEDALRRFRSFADGTRVGPLDPPNRRFDRDVRLAGCEPGELAAGPKNPALWRRGA